MHYVQTTVRGKVQKNGWNKTGWLFKNLLFFLQGLNWQNYSFSALIPFRPFRLYRQCCVFQHCFKNQNSTKCNDLKLRFQAKKSTNQYEIKRWLLRVKGHILEVIRGGNQKVKFLYKSCRFSVVQNLPSFSEPFVTFWRGNAVFGEIDIPWKNFELRLCRDSTFICKIWCLSGTHSSFIPKAYIKNIFERRRALHVSGSFRRTHLHFLKKMAAQT